MERVVLWRTGSFIVWYYVLVESIFPSSVQYSPIHLTRFCAGWATVPLLPKPAFSSPCANLKTVFKHFVISQGLFSHIIFMYACLFIE